MPDPLVYIPSENVLGRVESLMAYGAIVRYTSGGIEFHEMMDDEDYILLNWEVDNDE